MDFADRSILTTGQHAENRSADLPQRAPQTESVRREAQVRLQQAIRTYVDNRGIGTADLTAAVTEFTRAARVRGELPEQVIVELKRDAASALGLPREFYGMPRRTPFARLVAQLVTWAVDAYYAAAGGGA
jgi:hypothetical protein